MKMREAEALLELTGGMMGTPTDKSNPTPHPGLSARRDEDEVTFLVGRVLKKYFAGLSPEKYKRLEGMAKERRLKHVMNMTGLDPRDDLHWDLAKGQVAQYMRILKRKMQETFVRRTIQDVLIERDAHKIVEKKIDCDSRAKNKPFSTPDHPTKQKAVCAKQGDNEKLVRFGDKSSRIKKSNPKKRKSFRARHNCDTADDKLTARYWSCKEW